MLLVARVAAVARPPLIAKQIDIAAMVAVNTAFMRVPSAIRRADSRFQI
jgi:hypothetical protein